MHRFLIVKVLECTLNKVKTLIGSFSGYCETSQRFVDSSTQESSLTVTVAAILVSYLVCNVPANLILLLDPEATEYTGLHLPCYVLAWMSSIVKAACYIACTANFRSSLKQSVLRIWKNVSVSNRSQNM